MWYSHTVVEGACEELFYSNIMYSTVHERIHCIFLYHEAIDDGNYSEQTFMSISCIDCLTWYCVCNSIWCAGTKYCAIYYMAGTLDLELNLILTGNVKLITQFLETQIKIHLCLLVKFNIFKLKKAYKDEFVKFYS